MMKKLPLNDLMDVYIDVVLASKVSNSIALRFRGSERKRDREEAMNHCVECGEFMRNVMK